MCNVYKMLSVCIIILSVVVTLTLQVTAVIKGLDKLRRGVIIYYLRQYGADIQQPVCILPAYPCPDEFIALLNRPIVQVSLGRDDQIMNALITCSAFDDQLTFMLGISDIWIDDTMAESVGRISSLDCIGLERCQLTDERLGQLGMYAKIVSLSICENPVNGSGFARWKHPEKLLFLAAQSTDINDTTSQNLLILQNLACLDLSLTEVGDEGCRNLARLPKLKKLVLNGTSVGDQGLMHLAASPSLDFIEAICTCISDKGIEEFRRCRPDVKVFVKDDL